jgi:pimeloyl-ACP methyl ester carboxylesterase
MGHSGGGPHALACAAVLPERVLAAVCMSGLAPFGAERLDWFSDMAPSGAAELRAAAAGQRSRPTSPPPSSTRRCSPRATTPRSPVLGRGSAR